MKERQRVPVGISRASDLVYAVRALQILRSLAARSISTQAEPSAGWRS
jgi:3-polyprenyl-4-hydroxybenzoate decarboxylase